MKINVSSSSGRRHIPAEKGGEYVVGSHVEEVPSDLWSFLAAMPEGERFSVWPPGSPGSNNDTLWSLYFEDVEDG